MSDRSYVIPKAEVRKSSIHGKGLIATQRIVKGEIVAIKGGSVMDYGAMKKVEDKIEESYIQIEENFFIGATKKQDVKGNKLFMNHSCEPNVGIRGQITFVAIRNINEGEELTYDWAMENDGSREGWTLRCNCNKTTCRKIITGDDWRSGELQRRYGEYFSSYLSARANQRKRSD